MFILTTNLYKKIQYFFMFLIFFSTFLSATAPVVNLKGELSTNQGALNYSINLDLPKGIAGVTPKISLDYSSNGGNGLLGQGWSIGGLSKITRCGSTKTIDGKNRAVRYDDRDNFCLDGQRLISVGNNEYKTHIENYSKIKRYGSLSNPSGFTIKTKSGEVRYYGDDDYSSTYDTINGKNSTWYLTSIYDGYSNWIDFKYEKKNGLSRIRNIHYSNIDIQFNYGDDREDDRSDRTYGYISGKNAEIVTQLENVKILVAREMKFLYKLKYHEQPKRIERLKLKSIEHCINYSECSNPLVFKWQGQSDAYPTFKTSQSFPNINTNENDTKIADFNGDGFNDIYIVKSGANELLAFNQQVQHT